MDGGERGNMNRLLVTLAVIGLLVCCWGSGIKRLIPEDYSDQVAAYQSFAEEQAGLEAYGAAIDYYKEIIKLDPQAVYYSRLAELCQLAGKIDESCKVLDECVTRYPNEKDIFKSLIQYHFDSGNYNTCLNYLSQYAKANGWEPELIDMYYKCKYRFEIMAQGYEQISDYFNGSFCVKNMKKSFYLNDHFKKMQYPELEDASPDFGGLLGVTVEGHANFIDDTGLKYLDSTSQYDKTWSFIGALALVEHNQVYGYVDRQFRLIWDGYQQATNFACGVAAVQNQDGWMLINTSGQQIGDTIYSDVKMDEERICSFNNRIFAKLGDSYIMVDINGKQVGTNAYEDAKPFNRGAYAAVKKDGKWGFVNTANQWVIEPQYEAAESFGEELGAVCVDGKWGFVGPSGIMAIEPQFEAAKHLNGGFAPVKRGDLWYVLAIED